MGQKTLFNGKQIVLPGVYSAIKSKIDNPSQALSSGGVLIIDTGTIDTGFGSGPGIAGTLAKGKDAVQRFTSIENFRRAVGGGIWYLLAEKLFFPLGRGAGIPGATYIDYVRAAITTPCTMTYTFTGGGANGGTFTVQTRVEGTAGLGVEGVATKLTQGFAMTIEAGTVDPLKAVIKFWRGSFRGADTAVAFDNATTYDGVTLAQAATNGPDLLAQSPEFSNVSTLFSWAATNAQLNEFFKMSVSTVAGTGAITIAADVTGNPGNKLAISGTQTFNSTHLNTAFEALRKSQTDFVFSDCAGTNVRSALSLLIEGYIVNTAFYKKQYIVASGDDESVFATSLSDAVSFNDQYVTVVHGGFGERKQDGTYKNYKAIVKAALVCGREAGLNPQDPLTFKALNIGRELHSLTETQKEQAVNGGLLCTYYDEELEKIAILQGITTVQDNDFLVNNSGFTYSKQLLRISNQINKEIPINAKKKFFSSEVSGPNRSTVSLTDLDSFVKGYLKLRTVTSTQSNLLISFRNITVKTVGDSFFVNYEIIPNFEVNKGFFQGFIIDPTL